MRIIGNGSITGGIGVALGMAWYFDNGPIIIVEALLGWAYVSYKLCSIYFSI